MTFQVFSSIVGVSGPLGHPEKTLSAKHQPSQSVSASDLSRAVEPKLLAAAGRRLDLLQAKGRAWPLFGKPPCPPEAQMCI